MMCIGGIGVSVAAFQESERLAQSYVTCLGGAGSRIILLGTLALYPDCFHFRGSPVA